MPKRMDIPIAKLLEPPEPVRAAMDDDKLNELAADIRVQGVLQDLIVVPRDGNYEVVAGHRRLIACRIAGLTEVPCKIYDDAGFNDVAAKISENYFRQDVNPVEEGWFYKQLASRPGMTEEELVRLTHQKLPVIYQRMKLVECDEPIVLAVMRGDITMAVALTLQTCPDEGYRRYMLGMAIDQGAKRPLVESWIYQWRATQGYAPGTATAAAADSPATPVQPASTECFICKQSNAPYNLEMVFICRNEKALIQAMLKQAEASGLPSAESA